MKFNKKIFYPIILVVLFLAIFAAGFYLGNIFSYHVEQPGTLDFSLFWDSYNKLSKNFISPEKIDNKKVLYGAIDGMTRSLGDPYTTFFDPTQAQRFQQDLSGTFEGIGAEIGIKKDLLTIVAPLDGTPAQQSGLKPGDVIAKINGKDTTDMSTEEAVSLIRGPKGTIVKLSIFRNGWKDLKEFEITRAKIDVKPVKWSLKNDGQTAYIKVSQFDDLLSGEFKDATFAILQSTAKNIVLDLRGNPGGYLEVAQRIAGYLLEKDQIVTIEDFGKAGEKDYYKTNGGSELLKYPIVVLIDQGSASASEILAGALRDNRNVKLIGNKSFGKGSVQQVINLPDGSFLKITVAKWLTPKGASISEVGLSPDIKVDITDKDTENNKDPQLDKALEIIKTLP